MRERDCIHLGPRLSRLDTNGHFINCRVQQEYGCSVFGSCRINDPRAAHNCATCPAYSDDKPTIGTPNFDTRHLLYHIYPTQGTGTWQRNLDNLLIRMPLFNGRKVVGIVTDEKCDPPEAVRQYLDGWGCEFVEFPNDPMLREVVTWVPLWEKVIDLDGCTFYAHAKAVGRQWNPGVSCHLWADMMYETLLDYWPLVQLSLQSHALTGSFKKNGRGFTGCPSRWHYSGSFFWARNDLFRLKKWRDVPRQWWGTEAITGLLYDKNEGGCVFHESVHPVLNIYDPKYLNNVVLPELRRWRQSHQQNRTVIGT
jgi:hypothetical protein